MYSYFIAAVVSLSAALEIAAAFPSVGCMLTGQFITAHSRRHHHHRHNRAN